MHFLFSPRGSRARMSGFTLIELMITVAIVAVAAAIARPSYAGYIAKARRAEARTHLVEAAQYMQRFYAANDSFLIDRAGNNVITRMPANLKRSPADGTQLYELAPRDQPDLAPLITAMSFTLQMVPVASGAMSNDACGAFTLTSTGVRGVLVGTMTVPDTGTLRNSCWK